MSPVAVEYAVSRLSRALEQPSAALSGRTLANITHEAISAERLVALLKDWRTPTIPVHVIYAPNRYLSAKVRVFIDWAVTLFERHEDLRRS